MEVLRLPIERAVSRSQLPLVLGWVSVEVFDKFLFESYGIKLKEEERGWFAIDGKELCGSIEKWKTITISEMLCSKKTIYGQKVIQKKVSRMLAKIRTVVIKVLNETPGENRRSQLEDFSDDFDSLIRTLKKFNFL